MEVKSREYKLRGDTLYFRSSPRGYIEFEKLAHKSISKMEDSLEDSLMFIYACTKAGMKYEEHNFNMSYDEFIDIIDDSLEVLLDLLYDEDSGDSEGDPEKK